jgi:Protein of unknown function (DUF4241)
LGGDDTVTKFILALIGVALTFGIGGCTSAKLLEASNENMRTAIGRRGTYAKSCPEGHVDFSKFSRSGWASGVQLELVPVGSVNLPTGSVIASDPFYAPADAFPFGRRVEPGHYPLSLVVADLGPWGRRVAFARLELSRAAVVRWEVAETTDPSGLTEFFGVDAGLATVVDASTGKLFGEVLNRFDTQHPDGNYYDDVLSRDLPPEADWGEHIPDPTSDLNMIIFGSGLGDGLYFCYWGFDSSGSPASLILDFQLFDHEGTIVRR